MTHEFKEQPGVTDGFHQMLGKVTFSGNTLMSIRIRARDGSDWGPWSKLVGLYCLETPRVGEITTSAGTTINEGASFTLDIVFNKAMQLDTDVTLRLTQDEGSYPRFRGWLCEVTDGSCERTITVQRGQSAISMDMNSIEDDVWGQDPEFTVEIVPGTGYRAGHRNAVSFDLLDGSYVPELDSNDVPTGNTVFNQKADSVTHTFPRCGEGTPYPNFDNVGLMEVLEGIGTVQVPIRTIAGGNDLRIQRVTNDRHGTADNLNHYNTATYAIFQPLADESFFDQSAFGDNTRLRLPGSVTFNRCPDYSSRDSGETLAYRTAMHEAGHALGLSGLFIVTPSNTLARIALALFLPIDEQELLELLEELVARSVYEGGHPTIPGSVMNYDDEVPEIVNNSEPDCYPHPFDVMAVTAIYQMVD